MSRRIRVGTWNVNGLRARYSEVVAWAEQHQPEVFCLQEIKASPNQVPEPLTGLPRYYNAWHGTAGYSGVSLHVRRDFSTSAPRFLHPPFDVETRIVGAEVAGVLFFSAYVPNGGRDLPLKLRFLAELSAYVERLSAAGQSLVLCGDLNVARDEIDVHPTMRKAGAIGQLPEERELFARLLSRGLRDLLREAHPMDPRVFTWWPPWRGLRSRNHGWRIDYVLATSSLVTEAPICRVHADYGSSDHAPLLAELTV
jgi:exodeoxyribonuclease-3